VKKLKAFDVKKYRKEWYQKNKKQVQKRSKARYEKNKDEINKKRRGDTVEQRIKTSKRTHDLALLKSKPCTDCGHKFPACCMDFDHVRGKKLWNVSGGGNRKWSTILKEIAKCELVCANCHRIRTTIRKRRRK
jgi:hypothetical protein